MKTLIIYSTFEDLPKFAIVDGDYGRFDKIVIGTVHDRDNEEMLQDELQMFLYNADGKLKVEFSETFPLGQHFDAVANCGLIP